MSQVTRVGTIVEALGPRRYMIFPLASAVIGVADWVLSKSAQFGLGSVVGVPTWLVGLFVALLMVLWWLLDYAMSLRERFRPKLKLSFGKEIGGCIQKTRFAATRPGALGPEATFFRVKVEHQGLGTLDACTGHLVEVSNNGKPVSYGESLRLTFAPGESEDALKKSIADKVPEFLDVAFVVDQGGLGLGTKGRIVPYSLQSLFGELGVYRLRIVVSAPTVESVSVDLAFHVTGHYETTRIEPFVAA